MDLNDLAATQASIIGAMLIDESCIGRVLSETQAEDFTVTDYRMIYLAIRSLFREGRPVDPVTVLDAMGQSREPGSKFFELMRQCMDVTPTAANVGAYVPILRSQARLHQMQILGVRLSQTTDPEEAKDIVSRLNALQVDKPGLRITTMEQAVAGWFERMSTKPDYLPWGFSELDSRMYVEPGDFCIIGGYPSVGKTAFALGAAFHMAEKRRVGFFSLETNEKKLTDRLIARTALLSMTKIKKRDLEQADFDTVVAVTKKITGRKLEFIDAAGMTADDILAVAKARQYEVIYIDYLQLIRPAGGNDRFQQMTEVSITLHLGGQSSGITVVGLSQLSRPERTGGKRRNPRMSDLRETGQWEQDADTVMLLYLENEDEPKSRRVLSVEKNKEGEVGMIYLAFDGDTQLFKRHYNQEPPPLPKRKKQDGEQYTLRELKGSDPQNPFA